MKVQGRNWASKSGLTRLRIIEGFALNVFTLMAARQSGRNLVYADLIDDARQRDLGAGVIVFHASIARLLDLKAGSGRPKDVSDMAILSEIAHGQREGIPVDLATMEPRRTTPAGDSEQDDWPLAPGGESGPGH